MNTTEQSLSDLSGLGAAAKYISPHVVGADVLVIGTGFTEIQYLERPDILMSGGANSVTYLEVWDEYADKWSDGKYPIVRGNVLNIADIFRPNSFDIILWPQGPEHIGREEMPSCFQDILSVCRKVALFTCPWGSYYDAQETVYGNPYERHVQKSIRLEDVDGVGGFQVETYGEFNKGSGGLIIWREK